MKRPAFFPPLGRQAGAVLITGLIFLAVLTILGVTSARMSTLEERMSGNMRDRSVAMQAAEAALRDAERDISERAIDSFLCSSAPHRCIIGLDNFSPDCNLDGLANTLDDGLCARQGAGLPTYTDSSIVWPAFISSNGIGFQALTVNMTALPSVQYGAYTGAPPICVGSLTNGVCGRLLPAQPRYIIEGFFKQVGGSGLFPFYRITARAQGVNPSTVVWLQEVYTPP